LARGVKLRSPGEEFFDDAQSRLSLHRGDAFQEWNLLGADLYAVAGLGAVTYAARLHQCVETIFLECRASGVIVEEPDLADDRCPDEMIGGRVLRAGFETTSATDAAREGISFLLKFLGNFRALAEVVCAIDGNPCFDAFEIVEEARAVDIEIANERELGHRFQRYRAGTELINQSGTALADAAVDDHRAGAADFFETAAVIDDLGGGLAIGSCWMSGDVLKTGDDVHVGPARDGEYFPSRGLAGAILAADFKSDGAIGGSRWRRFRGCGIHCAITVLKLRWFFILWKCNREAAKGDAKKCEYY
jgi:hypothetical protein